MYLSFLCRKENYCLMQYIMDKFGGESHKFAIGLKASSYQNVFEWQNALAEFTGETDEFAIPHFNNWAPASPSGVGDCVAMTVGDVSTCEIQNIFFPLTVCPISMFLILYTASSGDSQISKDIL